MDAEGQREPQLSVHVVTVVGAVLVILALIAAGVVLSLSGRGPAEIGGLLTGLGGVAVVLLQALDTAAKLREQTRRQDRKLDKIEQQTNGALEDRMKSVVDQALRERFGEPRTVQLGQTTVDSEQKPLQNKDVHDGQSTPDSPNPL